MRFLFPALLVWNDCGVGWGMGITSLWFRVSVDRPVVFQSFSGFASRGIFFEVLRRCDEGLASLLHSVKGLAPYSTTPIFVNGGGGLRVVYRVLNPSVACLRICLLDSKLANLFVDGVLSEAEGGFSVRLVDGEFPLVGLDVRSVDFSEFLRGSEPVERFSILFRTPCFFRRPPVPFPSKRGVVRSGFVKRFYPLPIPELLFRNLVRLWRAFSGKAFNYEGFLEWVDAGGVALSGFPKGIRTIRVYEHPTANKWAVGFIGPVRFHLPEDIYSKKYARIVDMLLKFAEYSNIGGNRTAGFGVINYINKKDDE